jgi:hypothetical protein
MVAGPLLSLAGCVGWASASLPPALTPDEEHVIAGAHLPLTVGVVRHVHPAYSDSLTEALQDTGVFDRVAPYEEFVTPPDLVARVDRQIHGSAFIPFWTLVTLGLVPTSDDEHHGYSFWLEVPGAEVDRWHVEYEHTGRTTLGWMALIDVVVPDRTVFPFSVRGSQRMRDRLVLQILEHSESLADVARAHGR